MIKGIQLAQVVDVHPGEYAVSVVFPHMVALSGKGVRVRVASLAAPAHPESGQFELPQPGDWGLVAFYADDERSGVWIAALPDRAWNAVPNELMQRDPHARLEQHPSGRYTITEGDGSSETVWPDGTALQVLSKKDGQIGNRSWLGRLWERFVTRRPSRPWNPPERAAWSPPESPPVDLYLRHSSGAEVHLSADGSLWVRTAGGHTLELDDDTEAARDPETGDVTARGDGTQAAVRLRTAGGHAVTLDDGDGFAEVVTKGGRKVLLDDEAGATTVSDPAKIVLDAPEVLLAGEGGVPLARVGDSVEVTIAALPCTSGGTVSGTATGTITSGSSKAKSE
ncbi:hypothetical protein [Oceanithermus sp.]|uniref:hypothetical protein n=1 Tax=Oceanithermus sp. TaxID=2268145 RepID=UPI00257DE8F3|nr:hypothetical protein [Oceanithermus sp.]